MLAQTQAFELLITQSAFTSGAYPDIRGAGGGDHEYHILADTINGGREDPSSQGFV